MLQLKYKKYTNICSIFLHFVTTKRNPEVLQSFHHKAKEPEDMEMIEFLKLILSVEEDVKASVAQILEQVPLSPEPLD